MSAVIDAPVRAKRPHIAPREAYYTICPVFVASNVAVELGWLEEEFRRVGAKLSYLRSLNSNVGWLPHYNHRLPHLFRDGGNIPSISSKADTADTTLIGLTAGHHGGGIVVRTDSDIRRVGDLKGRRIGLYNNPNPAKVDWWRATGDRGIRLALHLAGLTPQDVEIENIDAQEEPFGAASKPSDLWSQRTDHRLALPPEVKALADGRVDAVYTSEGRFQQLERTGLFKVIEDLSAYPDWTLQVSNSPYAITVNSDFARDERDIIVAYLRAAIRAGRWINQNREAAADIFARVTYYPSPVEIARAISTIDFVPNLSAQNLTGVNIEKDFLVRHGYVRNNFEVESWADASFLVDALASLRS